MMRKLSKFICGTALAGLTGCGVAISTQMKPEDIEAAALIPDSVATKILQEQGVPPNWNYSQFAQSVTLIVYNRDNGKLGMQVQGGPGGFCTLPGQSPDSAKQVFIALKSLGSRAQYFVGNAVIAPCL